MSNMRTIRVTGRGQLKVHPDMTRIIITLVCMRGKAEKSGEKPLKNQNQFFFSSPYLRTPLSGILYKMDYL